MLIVLGYGLRYGLRGFLSLASQGGAHDGSQACCAYHAAQTGVMVGCAVSAVAPAVAAGKRAVSPRAILGSSISAVTPTFTAAEAE